MFVFQVIFDGFFYGKSQFFTTIWGICSIFPSKSKMRVSNFFDATSFFGEYLNFTIGANDSFRKYGIIKGQ